jgi:hypothetical protein
LALSKAAPVCGHWRVMETDISSRAYLRMRRNDRGSTSPRRGIHKCRRRPPAAVFFVPGCLLFPCTVSALRAHRSASNQAPPTAVTKGMAHEVATGLADRERALYRVAGVGGLEKDGNTSPTGANRRRSAIRLLYGTSATATAISAGIVRRCQPSQPLAPLSSPLASAEAASAVFAIS